MERNKYTQEKICLVKVKHLFLQVEMFYIILKILMNSNCFVLNLLL